MRYLLISVAVFVILMCVGQWVYIPWWLVFVMSVTAPVIVYILAIVVTFLSLLLLIMAYLLTAALVGDDMASKIWGEVFRKWASAFEKNQDKK